jgi:hypothetical protein
MKSKDKCGSGWTVHKLITIILLILILAIVVAGVITGGLNPMIERLGEKYDNVLAKFGIGENKTIVDENCFPWENNGEVPSGMEGRICRGYCEFKDGEKNYTYHIETGEFKKNGKDIRDLLEYNETLVKLYEDVLNSKETCQLYGSKTLCLKIPTIKEFAGRVKLRKNRLLFPSWTEKTLDSIKTVDQIYFLKGADLWIEERIVFEATDKWKFPDHYAKKVKPDPLVEFQTNFYISFIFGSNKEDRSVFHNLEILERNKEIYNSLRIYCGAATKHAIENQDKLEVDKDCSSWESTGESFENAEIRTCEDYCEFKDGEKNYSYHIETGEFKEEGIPKNYLLENFDENIKEYWNLAIKNNGASIYPLSTIISETSEDVIENAKKKGKWLTTTIETYPFTKTNKTYARIIPNAKKKGNLEIFWRVFYVFLDEGNFEEKEIPKKNKILQQRKDWEIWVYDDNPWLNPYYSIENLKDYKEKYDYLKDYCNAN